MVKETKLHSVHRCSERLEHRKTAILIEPGRLASNQRYDSIVELVPKRMVLVGRQENEN